MVRVAATLLLGLAVVACASGGRPAANGPIAFDVVTRPGGIYVVRADGSGLHDLTPKAPDADDPAWSPDGRHIAYVRGAETGFHSDIWVANADGTHQHRLTHFNTVSPGGISWSSGGLIAFAGLQGGLFVVPAAGGRAKQIRAPESVSGPAFSPDGQEIAFSASPNGRSQIYVEHTIGGPAVRLTKAHANNPAWSPDGLRIAYTGAVGKGEDVFVVGVDGTGPKRLSRTQNDGFPEWAPNGRLLVYVHEGPFLGKGDLFIVRPDGTGRKQLTHGAHPLSNVSWRRG